MGEGGRGRKTRRLFVLAALLWALRALGRVLAAFLLVLHLFLAVAALVDLQALPKRSCQECICFNDWRKGASCAIQTREERM